MQQISNTIIPYILILERCELQSFTNHSLSHSKPYSRLTVAKNLVEIYGNRNQLSRIEKDLLERYLYEFSDDIERVSPGFISEKPFIPIWGSMSNLELLQKYGLFQNRRNIASYTGKDRKVFANTIGGFDYTSKLFNEYSTESGTQLVSSNGFSARACIKKMDFAGWTSENQMSGDAKFIDRDRFPYKL